MHTPTALLRVAAAFGSQGAKATLSARKADKCLIVSIVRNGELPPLTKTVRPAEPVRAPQSADTARSHQPLETAKEPAASAPAVGRQPVTAWRSPPSFAMPGKIEIPQAKLGHPTRLKSVVATKQTSWLHHGPGAVTRAPSPAKAEQHPRGLQHHPASDAGPVQRQPLTSALGQRSMSAITAGEMNALNRQAEALQRAEKNLSTFFGEVEPDYATAADCTRVRVVANPSMPERSANVSIDHHSDSESIASLSDSESIASLSDSESGDEWDDVSPEEQAAADARYAEEEREIAELDREFFGSHYPGTGASSKASDLRASIRGQSSDQNVAKALMDAARKAKDTTQAFEYDSDSGDESDHAEPNGLDELKLHANQHQRYMERSSAQFEAEFQKLFATPNAEPRAKAPEPATDGTGGKPEKNADVADMRDKLMADIRAAAAERNARMDPTATAALEPQATETSRTRGETLLLDIFNEMNSRHKLTKDSGNASDSDSDDDDSGNHTDRSEASFSDGSISD